MWTKKYLKELPKGASLDYIDKLGGRHYYGPLGAHYCEFKGSIFRYQQKNLNKRRKEKR